MGDLSPRDDLSFPAALRAWRLARGMSQFDLAEAVGMSTRHLSFLETGRAKPSREMALALCDGLMAPREARNALLMKAGYAPIYPSSPLNSEALAPLRAILTEMMHKHAPNPAMVCDRHWHVLEMNATAAALLAPLQGEHGETNIVRMLTQSPVAAQVIENHAEVIQEMRGRIRLEALEAGRDPVLTALASELDAAAAALPATTAPRRPLAPVIIRTPQARWQFLSAIAHFGTSEDVTVRDLRLELLFPADAGTRNALAGLG